MDDGLKQRLVGAIVLVAIAVLFLPSLFDRDSRRTVDLGSEIPREPPVTTRMLEVEEPEPPEDIPSAKPLAENYPHEEVPSASADSGSAAAHDSQQMAQTEEPEREESDSDARSAASPEPSSDSKPEPSSEASPEPLSESGTDETTTTGPELNAEGVPDAWSLQVGSFGSGERAVSLLKRLQEAGYKSYIREGISTQGAVYRVFVGPKINKAAAQAEKQNIDKQFNTSALLVEFKP